MCLRTATDCAGQLRLIAIRVGRYRNEQNDACDSPRTDGSTDYLCKRSRKLIWQSEFDLRKTIFKKGVGDVRVVPVVRSEFRKSPLAEDSLVGEKVDEAMRGRQVRKEVAAWPGFCSGSFCLIMIARPWCGKGKKTGIVPGQKEDSAIWTVTMRAGCLGGGSSKPQYRIRERGAEE